VSVELSSLEGAQRSFGVGRRRYNLLGKSEIMIYVVRENGWLGASRNDDAN
jgi:hypothetical protein